MPATPQMNNVPPSKFSPFGGAINKSLLTPCRRVGLSRKRKTPNSFLKLPSHDGSFSEGHITSPLPTEVTPVINKNDLHRRRSKMNFDSPMKENGTPVKDNIRNSSSSLESTPVNITTNSKKRKSKIHLDTTVENENAKDQGLEKISSSDSKAKKRLSLGDSAVNTTPVKEVMDIIHSKNEEETKQTLTPTTFLNSENEKLKASILASPKDIEFREKNPLQSESTPITPLRQDDSISVESLVIPKSKKTKILYDSDEDFLPSNKTMPKLKRTKSETPRTKKTEIKLVSKTKSENMVDCLKDCKINLKKLGENEMMSIENKHRTLKKVTNDSSDDEVVARVRKKTLIIISDDEDDFQRSQKTPTNQLREHDYVMNSKNSVVKKAPSQMLIDEKTFSKKPSLVDILEDEEDAFTSTPDRDRNEKKDLIGKITILEKQIKEKRKILDNLKQASVYKSIHNIEDLGKLTEKYREGCENGLKGLLSQLQAHGPMNMGTLLNNLRIPPEMISRLSLSEGSDV